MTVTVKDLGIGKLRENLAELGRLRVLVGVQGTEATATHPNSDESVGQVAYWLHFGTKRMAARPFIDRAVAELQNGATVAVKRAAADLVDGRSSDPVATLKPLGSQAVQAVAHEIATSREWAAPLAAVTVTRKGHDQPLVDTGTVSRAVTYTIRDGGSIRDRGR